MNERICLYKFGAKLCHMTLCKCGCFFDARFSCWQCGWTMNKLYISRHPDRPFLKRFRFNYDEKMKEYIKQYPGTYWSNGFWIAPVELTAKIAEHFRKEGWEVEWV